MKLTDPNSKKRFPFILKPVEEKIEIHRLRGRERKRVVYREKKEGERKRRTSKDNSKIIQIERNQDSERKRLKMRDKKR